MNAHATASDFRNALDGMFAAAIEEGRAFVDVKAGDLHRVVGGYPGAHRMPNCCQVMRSAMMDGDAILSEPPKGAGATLTIRYLIPREARVGSGAIGEFDWGKGNDALSSQPNDGVTTALDAGDGRFGSPLTPTELEELDRLQRRLSESGHALPPEGDGMRAPLSNAQILKAGEEVLEGPRIIKVSNGASWLGPVIAAIILVGGYVGYQQWHEYAKHEAQCAALKRTYFSNSPLDQDRSSLLVWAATSKSLYSTLDAQCPGWMTKLYKN